MSESLEDARALLASGDLDERCRGVTALQELGTPQAGEELVGLLAQSSWFLRERVVEALVAHGDPPVEVMRVLSSGTWYSRASACDVLGRRGDRGALPGLLAAVEDRNVSLQKSAVRALEQLAERYGLACIAEGVAALPGERRRRIVARVGHQVPDWAHELDAALDDVPEERWSSESGLRRPPALAATNRGVEARALTRFRRWLAGLAAGVS